MAKKKQKKIKKELDKLQRTGRYWEWLLQLGPAPHSPDTQKDTQKAWQEIIRRALRSPQGFEEFRENVVKVQAVPKLPEIRLLRAVGDLMDNLPVSEEVFETKGLSGPVQDLCERLKEWTRKDVPWAKMENLLADLAARPEKITRRHYTDLARLVSDTHLEKALIQLGSEMNEIRKLNHKGTLKKLLSKYYLGKLGKSDATIAKIVEHIPGSLQKLLLLPFCTQTILYLRNCEVRPYTDWIIDYFDSLKFLFPHVAGDKSKEILDKLLPGEKKLRNADGIVSLEREFNAAPFEDRLKLLAELRVDLKKILRAREDPFSDLFDRMFGDDRKTEAIEQFFIRAYQMVFKEMAQKAPTLSGRDRRAVQEIMDRVVYDDLGLVFIGDGDTREMADFLIQAAQGGCMGKHLSMLGLILSRWDKSQKLLPLAAKALEEAIPPTGHDVRELFDDWLDLINRSPANVRLIAEKLPSRGEAFRELEYQLWQSVQAALIFPSNPPGGPLAFLAQAAGKPPSAYEAEVKELLSDMRALTSQFSDFQTLETYLQIFSSARMEPEALLRWLDTTWKGPDLDAYFDKTVEMIFSLSTTELEQLFMPFEPRKARSRQGAQWVGAILEFFKTHSEEFMTMPAGRVDHYMEYIDYILNEYPHDGTAVIRLYNVISARADAGEVYFRKLSEYLKSHLKSPRTTAPKTPPRGKKR